MEREDRFFARIAGLDWEIEARYPLMRTMCEDYLIPSSGARPVSPCIAPKDDDIAFERAKSENGDAYSDTYLETLAVLRSMAEQAPRFGRVLFHGVALEFCGMAYLLCAPSGTGKSTHAKLWRSHLGKDVRILNGDKPFVGSPAGVQECDASTSIVAYGSPWMGKEGWGANASAPLGGICMLGRANGDRPCAAHVDPARVLPLLSTSVYMPQNPVARIGVAQAIDAISRTVPVFEARVAIDEYSVQVVRDALTQGIENESEEAPWLRG